MARYRIVLSELTGEFYSEMSRLLGECEERNSIPQRYRSAMLKEIEKMMACVEEEMKCSWK